MLGAVGSSPACAYHRAHGNGMLSLISADGPTCACVGPVYGFICGNAEPAAAAAMPSSSSSSSSSANCIAFPTDGDQQGQAEDFCPAQPLSDLRAFGNPTCSVDTYAGGLRCCHHLNVLLDADQVALLVRGWGEGGRHGHRAWAQRLL